MALFTTKTIEEVTETLIDYRGKTPKKTNSGIKLITAKVIKGGTIIDGNHEYIAENNYEIWMRRGLPKQWDILITTEAPLGEVAQLRTSERVALAQRVILLRGKQEVIDQGYYFQAMKSPFVQAELKARATGTTVLGIKQSELRQIRIPYFPLPTQHKIASILSAYDNLIENNTRRIQILEEMAQALYREWFVEFRFPGHEKVKMVESELGMMPEGWEVKKLEDVCLRITDGSHWSPKTVDDGYPMASVKNMNDWGFEISQCRKIAKEDYEKLIRNDCKPLEGDILIAKDGSYLKHIFVTETEHELVILSSIAIIRPNNQIFPYMLSFYLREPSIKARMAGYVSGVAIPRIVLKDFRKFLIIVPTIDVQSQFINLVEPMIKNCYRMIEKNDKLRRTRDLLLPKLISGEVDVSSLDIPTGELT